MKRFKSNAQWPKGTIGTDGDVSTDDHGTYEQADAVCHLLHKNGFGGDGKVFPIRTWVEECKPDITTHPLYRAHHGDMTGWRYLEVGEKIIQGDEVYIAQDGGWVLSSLDGYEIQSCDSLQYRRRIAHTQPEAKRYVTLVLDMDKSSYEELFDEAIAYREGNALMQLDTIEERVTKALKGQD